MSVRNLDRLFKPQSVALIGATPRPGALGGVVLRNLRRAGLARPPLLVNPKHETIGGLPVYPSIAALPVVPDLAVIATPPATVPGLIAELGARGTRAAIIITAGFAELGSAGSSLQQETLAAARPHLLRLVGPNCVGVIVPKSGLDASFSHIAPKPGDLAFVSQSGAMITAVLDWAAPRDIGFSHVVSLGDMADVDFGDMLDYLAADPDTRAILLYVEAITHARKFMSAARSAARSKPVLVVKAGRVAEGARAAASHTGALTGSDAVYDAAFRRAGMLRVESMDELFDAVETLALTQPQFGERLAILTNGGGPGVLTTDALIAAGGHLANLSQATIARLDAVLPPLWSHGNPVDIIGDAPGRRFGDALRILLEEPQLDAILVLSSPTALADPAETARAVIETAKAVAPSTLSGRNLLTAWLGEQSALPARAQFAAARIATYDTPEGAVRGFMHRVRYRRNQELLMETPAARPEDFTPDIDGARRVIRNALARGASWLDPEEAAELLGAYGLPLAKSRIVIDAESAATAASALGLPVALKIRSPDITHKSDVGGVALNLGTADHVRSEAAAMLTCVNGAYPGARIEGFLVQQMVQRPGALELLIGLVDDAVFGPVVMFGQGGTAVELLHDTSLELPPLNAALARAQMARTRVWRLLQGYRNTPAANIQAIADVLIRVAQMAADHPELRELDINPLLADAQGTIIIDARLRIAAAKAPGAARLAILPYPKELESTERLADGTALQLRPVRPEDEPVLQDLAAHMAPLDLRRRFFAPMKQLSHTLAARLSQLDYDREIALVARLAATGAALGVVRYAAEPDHRRAEFAIALRSDWKGRGLGRLLMTRIMAVARQRGISELVGDVLHENEPMLRLARALGFTLATHPGDADLVRVKKAL